MTLEGSDSTASRGVIPQLVWSVAAALALIGCAAWLQDPRVRYLALGGIATVAAIVVLWRLPRRGRGWSIATAAILVAFWLTAGVAQRDLLRLTDRWSEHRSSLAERGERAVVAALDSSVTRLRSLAAGALELSYNRNEAFRALTRLPISAEQGEGIVLLREGAPWAWAGRVVAPYQPVAPPVQARSTGFYIVLEVRAANDSAAAIASSVVDARSPADRLTSTLAGRLATRLGLADVMIADAGALVRNDSLQAYTFAGDTVLAFEAAVPEGATARLFRLSRARAAGGVLLTLGLLMYLLAHWRQAHGVPGRLAPIGVALACLALVPLNLLSSFTPLFDPAVYFARLGGPFSASVGALGLASALVLLAMLVVLRSRLRARSMWLPLVVVVAIVTGGPFLLRRLSAGISTPPGGLSTAMWLSWEVALFLAAAAMLLAAASAGSALLGPRRGLSPFVAPALAAVAAMLAPVMLYADARWPPWYPALWIAAVGAMALTRRHRGVVLAAASVAALGATTLAWRAEVQGRVVLANRDVSGLDQERAELRTSLARLGDELADGPVPFTSGALLRAYARSDLEGSGYPMALATWSDVDDTLARITLARLAPDDSALSALRDRVRLSGTPEVQVIPGAIGVYHALAVPFDANVVTTAVIAPRTRLLRDDPDNVLLGVAPRERGEPPYALTLGAVENPGARPGGDGGWSREGDELHGDRIIQTGTGAARAHIEIDLRSFDVLVQRGTLVVLLDLLLLLTLWSLSVWPEGAFRRWLRRRRERWARSFRLRLTVALFGFFIIPAVAFAAWSYRQLQLGDRQSRELLVRETLRSAEPGSGEPSEGDAPLLVFRDGVLISTSEPLLEELAPTGTLLPPAVAQRISPGGEVETSDIQRIGSRDILFGYRALSIGNELQLVIATPAAGNEDVLDRRRRDLGVLVAFFTVLGAMAALWLSGVAARSLAMPIGRLRDAALAIAGGELEPPLPARPPAEFVPVFSAFRRMGRDLQESRAELESAQRRTTAVLRNVASAVIAVSGEGRVTIANPRAAALLGHEPADGESVGEALGEPLAGVVASFLSGSTDEEEFDVEREGRQLHARLTRLARGGAVLTLDDVTEMARAQRVLAWGEMARQVAHEIKNPLTPIRLGVQHLRRAYSDARVDFEDVLDSNVGRILSEIDRLDEIARGFSRYGMAPAERQPAEPTDVAAVARDAVDLERIGRDGTEWRIAGAAQPVLAAARADELREVLINVLENARLAGASCVELVIEANGKQVRVDVRDDGEGIATHLLARIFEPHFSTRTSGSGLGLAISRQILEGWGGEIAIASEPGVGTTVSIHLRAA
ncbi:MAG: sensor histidine kinase [Gemmatimonadaceae bacterium]